MGEFAKEARHGKIAGPSQPGFRREAWEKRVNDPALDDDDKRILVAGLFLDDLLSFLRAQIRLSDIDMRPEALIRLTIGLATHSLFKLHEATRIARPLPGTPAELDFPSLLSATVSVPGGQAFAPDELITGAGDGMKHMFRRLLASKAKPGDRDEHDIGAGDIDHINTELNHAVLYDCAVGYWHACLGHGYGLAFHEAGVMIHSARPDFEIARFVSMYRRQNIFLQNNMEIVEWWLYKWPAATKKALCGIPLVRRIYGSERIERIELGLDDKVLDTAVTSVAAMLWLQHGYYRKFMDEPLPGLGTFTLNQIVAGWRILQSLAMAIFDSPGPVAADNLRELLRFSPRISGNVLRTTFAKALALDAERAAQLIDVFVFQGRASQDLWSQPLMSVGEDYCLVVPCIHSVHLERIIESWMRQGGLDLDRRGAEFEKFCRHQLHLYAQESPIARSVAILDQGVKFTPAGGQPEQIDVVVLVGDAVLLVEAKCILWPDDALQFSNYRDTVEKAAAQIRRKRDAVASNYPAFAHRLRGLGHIAPAQGKVIGCVLTNSAVYAGFPIDGIPVIDLPILGAYLENRYVKADVRQGSQSLHQHVLQFYDDALQAGLRLDSYLSDPPQLSDMKRFVKPRDIVFPVESPAFGKLVHRSYRVEVDSEEMKQRYGSRAAFPGQALPR